jgi:DNA replication protein DnaD
MQISRRREIIKIRAKINETETKNNKKQNKQTNKKQRINETKSWFFERQSPGKSD